MSRDRLDDRRARGRAEAVLVALVVLVAAVGTAYVLGVVGAPAVTGVENRFGEVTNETTEVETDLAVSNPNPMKVALGETTVDYTVRMNGVSMANGTKEGLTLARGNTTLAFTTRMHNDRIPPWWVTHVRNDENTTVTVDATVTSPLLLDRAVALQQEQRVHTDVIGAFNSEERRPVNADRAIVSDPVLYVNRTTAAWGNVSDTRTPIDVSFLVYNPKTTPYTITEIGYAITMNGIAVGEGASRRSYVIEGGTTEEVATTTAIRNERLDEWWVSHLRNDQVTQLRIDFYARIQLTGDLSIRVPLDELTYERTVETDVFGTKSEGADGTGGSGGSDEAAESTPTPDGTPGLTDVDTDDRRLPSTTPSEPTSTEGSILGGTPTPGPSPGGDGSTSTRTPTRSLNGTSTPASAGTPTPTDDGGLLSAGGPPAGPA